MLRSAPPCRWWSSHTVRVGGHRRKHYHHPLAGDFTLDSQQLRLARDVPQLATGELDHLADFAFEDGWTPRARSRAPSPR